MLAFIVAALYVGISALLGDDVLSAIEWVLTPLFWWYTAWAILVFCILCLFPLIGWLAVIFADKSEHRVGGLVLMLGSPFIIILGMIPSISLIIAVWLISLGVQDGQIIDKNYFVGGLVLYGVALIIQLSLKANSSSSDKKD